MDKVVAGYVVIDVETHQVKKLYAVGSLKKAVALKNKLNKSSDNCYFDAVQVHYEVSR